MYNLYVIIITAIVLVILYRFYIAMNGKIKNFSITSLYCIYYIVFILIGSALLNCCRFDAEEEFGVYSRPDVLLSVWMYSLLGLVFIFVGFAFSHIVNRNYSFKRKQRELVAQDITYVQSDFSKKSYSSILMFSLVVLVATLLYRNAIGRFPLESIFSGLSSMDLVLLRSDATNGFEGKIYRYEMFMDELPLFLFILTAFIRKGSSKKKWSILFYLLLAYNVFFALSTLQKAPIINLIILAVILYAFIHKSIPKKHFILILSAILGLIVLMYIFFMGNAEVPVSIILQGAAHRVFIGSIIPFYWYIIYVEQKGFLFGTSFPNPAGILPFEHVPLTKEIALIGQSSGDAVGSMPTAFIGEMYVNFGVFGILFFCFLFGFLLQTMDIYFTTRLAKKKTVLTCSIYVYFMFYFTQYATSPLSPIILDTSLYMVLLFYFIYKSRTLYRRPKEIVQGVA